MSGGSLSRVVLFRHFFFHHVNGKKTNCCLFCRILENKCLFGPNFVWNLTKVCHYFNSAKGTQSTTHLTYALPTPHIPSALSSCSSVAKSPSISMGFLYVGHRRPYSSESAGLLFLTPYYLKIEISQKWNLSSILIAHSWKLPYIVRDLNIIHLLCKLSKKVRVGTSCWYHKSHIFQDTSGVSFEYSTDCSSCTSFQSHSSFLSSSTFRLDGF